MQIADCAALVTGGASGLGLAAARALVQKGATVVIADLSMPANADLHDLPEGSARVVTADVRDEQSVARALDVAREAGPLRIVVNCAGVGIARRVLGRDGAHPLSEFARVLNVNLLGTFNVTRLAAEHMATVPLTAGERGVIVNTASIAAFDGQIGQVAYSASKGGIAAMTLPLARDLATHAIRVMSIAPGLFETPLLGVLNDTALNAMTSQIPHPHRLGHPDEFARLVIHAIENPMLNGEVVRLDAGLRMPPR